MTQEISKRIYVCHTFYHVYISFLKELALPLEERGNADIVLSRLSTDFKNAGERIVSTGIFQNAYDYDEKRETFFPELNYWRKNRGNIVANSLARIIFTKKYSKLQEPFIPVDFKKYKDIYVYCDNDPIGWYLSGHRIYYHAVEDGLNYLKPFVPAVYDNRGAFKFKVFLSDKLNLLFIRDGFNKYCLDMEVNDISVIEYPCKKYKEVPRQALFDRLTKEDKEILLKAFVDNLDALKATIASMDKDKESILVLTEPLTTDLNQRAKIFRDIIDEYSKYGTCFLKPHPRDELDYPTVFSDVPQFASIVPMEMLNFFDNLHFNKVVGVFTQLDSISFADEKITLGKDFMDKYEDPEKHRWYEKK